MKKNISFLLLPVLLFFYSCEKETLPVYDSPDQIYFNYADNTVVAQVIDSTIVSFGYDFVIKSDSIFSIKVKVMGKVADYDRPVAFVLDPTSTAKAGVDIDLIPEQSFVPADSITGKVTVRLKNTQTLTSQALKAALKLVDNEFFQTNYKTTIYSSVNNAGKIVSTEYRIWFNCFTDLPSFWAHTTYAVRFNSFFGPYSRKKFVILCDLFGFDWDYLSYPAGSTSAQISALYNARFPSALTIAWSRAFNTYLDEYESINGTRLLEENGQPMVGGSAR
jgi:hypothetical protein